MNHSISTAVKRQILNWLKDKGIGAIAVLKVTGRCVVYQMKQGYKKGCTFVPVELLKAKNLGTKKHNVYLLSQHTAYTSAGDVRFMYGVEAIAAILTGDQLEKIKAKGVEVFATWSEAMVAEGKANYPDWHTGLLPRVVGRFINLPTITKVPLYVV